MKPTYFLILIILTSLSNIISAQTNEFKIGIFGSSFMTHNVNGCIIPFETPLDGNGNKTSLFNVLAEDGFNIYQTYEPSEWTSINSLKSEIRLASANGLQVELNAGHYYKPTVDVNGNYLGYGTNEYTNCGNNIDDCQNPYSQGYFRADIDNYIEKIFANSEFSNIIWGYHICEEASYYHYQHFADNCQGNIWGNSDYFKHVEIPPSNVNNAISYFKNCLSMKGITNHKIIVMEANHHKSINSNTDDGQGIFNPQQYLHLLNKSNNRDVFFEGSYTQFPATDWFNYNYSNIDNSGPDNNWHYLGAFKSIEYAYNYSSEVHKVINIERTATGPNYFAHYHSNPSIPNANWLWFQAYTSIIHGAKGIWFWGLNYSWDLNETNNWGNISISNRFNRNYFPINYQNYTSYLAKELRFLVNKNIINTDANTIVATKIDSADPNCIVPSATSYIPTNLPVEKQTENYGLRYTIRSNGIETYMIITNPLNVAFTVTLNLSNSSNEIIQNSSGVNVMFDNNQYSPTSNNYKVNRESNINLSNNTVGNQYYIGYSSNKNLTLTFGPMDVKILKFISSPQNYDNGWDKIWSNNGNGNIDNYRVNNGDIFYTGDFDGDGSEELLCVAYTPSGTNDWITLLKFVNNDWECVWSNYGSSALGNGIYTYRNSFIVGDYDGDGKDELFGNSANDYTTLFRFTNGNWTWIWSDYGNSQHSIRPYKDKFYAGDFDGDGKDELFGCDLPDGWTTTFDWDGSNFVCGWSDYGSNHAIRPYRANMIASDFDGDGKTELLGFSSWSTLFHFDNGNWQWGWSTYNANNFNSWTYPPLSTDEIIAGNLDSDVKDELFFLETHASADLAATMDLKSDQSAWDWNWSAGSQNVAFIDDWPLAALNGGSNTKYYLVKAEANESEYLLTMRKFCNNYLVNMYKPTGIDNKSAIIDSGTDMLPMETINDIIAYPNPVLNILNISLPDKLQYKIELIDLSGKKIKMIDNVEGPFIKMDCSEVNPGIYLIRACSSKKIFWKKIVISK